jgi:hypothetical protein
MLYRAMSLKVLKISLKILVAYKRMGAANELQIF